MCKITHTPPLPHMHSPHLVHYRGASINDHRLDAGLEAELASLLVDLAGQLTCGGQDEGEGHGLARASALKRTYVHVSMILMRKQLTG